MSRPSRDEGRRRLRRFFNCRLIDLSFDDDAFEAAQKPSFFENDVVRQLNALDAERFRRHRQCFVEILAFESLSHDPFRTITLAAGPTGDPSKICS
jgi:hypothetical protein